MKAYKYSIVGVIDGQRFVSNNNTFAEFKRLFEMIEGFGGFVLEYTKTEINI